uniref:Uncharacterized protein n=1 Tax=Solanum tuberosum TaxID=4113 RepID=M1CPZ2_SOLTU
MKVPNQDLSKRARAYSISEFFCISKLQKELSNSRKLHTKICTDPEFFGKIMLLGDHDNFFRQ